MCGVQLKDSERFKDFMLMLGLNETIDQFAMAISVHWYGHVLRRENCHVLRMALYLRLKVKGQNGGRRLHRGGRLRKEV